MIARLGWDGVLVLAAGLVVAAGAALQGPQGVGHWIGLVLLVDVVYVAVRLRG